MRKGPAYTSPHAPIPSWCCLYNFLEWTIHKIIWKPGMSSPRSVFRSMLGVGKKGDKGGWGWSLPFNFLFLFVYTNVVISIRHFLEGTEEHLCLNLQSSISHFPDTGLEFYLEWPMSSRDFCPSCFVHQSHTVHSIITIPSHHSAVFWEHKWEKPEVAGLGFPPSTTIFCFFFS